MSDSGGILDQFKNLGSRIGQQIQDSPTFAQLKDRYENLSPNGQKLATFGAVFIVLFLALFIPIANLSDSQTTLNGFEEKRSLIRELFKTYRESSATPNISLPPPQDMLRSSIDSVLTRADLIPEQKLGIIEIAPEGTLIPANLTVSVLQVQLAKLNLKQIVDIGASLVGISDSIKLKDMQITANRQDTRYYDVNYKLYTLKVPQPQVELPPEPEKPSKKNRGSDQ